MSAVTFESAVEMIRRRRWWFIAGLAFVFVALLFGHLYAASQAVEGDDREESDAVAVQVVRVGRGDIEKTTEVMGQTAARASVDLVPKMAGQIKEVYAHMGQQVTEGDALVRLDDSDVSHKLKQAQAGVKMAKAKLAGVRAGAREEEMDELRAAKEAAQEAFSSAEWTYERMQRLHERDVISGAKLREAKTEYTSAKSQMESAEARLAMADEGARKEEIAAAEGQLAEAQAALEGARNALKDTVLRSPIDGRVAYVEVDPGDMVSAGTPAVGVVAVDPIRVDALFTAPLVGALEPGAEATVEVPAAGGEFTGEVTEIAPSPDPKSGMYPVRILIDNPDVDLRPGMTAQVEVIKERAEDVLIIPRRALSSRGDEHYVFVVRDGVARRRAVRLGLRDEERVAVLDGLREGQMVVSEGVEYVEDEMEVKTTGESD